MEMFDMTGEIETFSAVSGGAKIFDDWFVIKQFPSNVPEQNVSKV